MIPSDVSRAPQQCSWKSPSSRVSALAAGAVLFLLLAGHDGLAAGRELPSDGFSAKSDLERRFREAQLLEEGDRLAAVQRYRELSKAKGFPAPDALHWALGRLTTGEESAGHWRAVLNAQPRSPFVYEALKELQSHLKAKGKFPEAEGVARQALDVARTDAERATALSSLLPLLDTQGKAKELETTARRLWLEFAAFPESRAAEPYLARSGNPFDVVSPEELFARGQKLMNRGSREEAARTLQELLQRLPEDSPLVSQVSLALGTAFVFLRRHSDALGPLAVARQDPKWEEEARHRSARALFGLNRGDEGAKELAALARRRPRAKAAPDYLLQAARVFERRRLWRQARRAESRILRRHARSSEARQVQWGRGWSALHDERYGEAATRFGLSMREGGRDWPRAQGLYWQGRALLLLGEEELGRNALEKGMREFPLGYYALRSRNALEGMADAPLTADPRGTDRELPSVSPPSPPTEDVSPSKNSETLGRAELYLRLGLPAAAREVLRVGNGGIRQARLLYWAEDFHGALAASGKTWLDWPGESDPAALDAGGLAYPIAYPKSVTEAAREAGIHPHLLLAIAHTESHFNPRVYSSAEARGLMQFIPSTGAATARALGLSNFTVESLYDPGIALRMGARHLRELADRFEGDLVLAAAAYNAGSGAVERWRKEFGGLDEPSFVETIPFRETRLYVKKVLTALDAYARLDPPGLVGPQE